SKQVMDFLEEHGMERKLSNKIGIAIEEMVENIYKFSGEKKVHIDLRLVVNKENVVLSFCDDGIEFDPTTYQSEEKEEFAIDNIMMLKAVSKKMEYQRVIGLNKTMVKIS
ncbi:MAG: ATP-binding protein, partial [Lachnospiraceae bacterium]